MNGIKLISKLEYDMVVAGSLDFFDTKKIDNYRIGDFVDLRCYFTSFHSGLPVDILVVVKDIVRIAFNVKSSLSLYRAYFEIV